MLRVVPVETVEATLPTPLSDAVRNSPSGVGGAVGLVLEGLARV